MNADQLKFLDLMTHAITDLTLGKVPEPLTFSPHEGDHLKPLFEAVNRLIAVNESAGAFVSALACGQLDVVPPPRNHLIAPFKQLHSNLKHLVWQTQEVAQGNYSQRVDFLGDFAEAFNAMIDGLRDKKRLQEELQRARDELEVRVRQRTEELNQSLVELKNAQAHMVQSEKMVSLGQLAAGVAHEINNPIGFVGSNLNTLAEYQAQFEALIIQYRELVSFLEKGAAREDANAQMAQIIQDVHKSEAHADVDYLLEDARDLVQESRQGAKRIAKIVFDLKHFAHPGEDRRNYTDLNACMESTLNVVWNEIKYKAEVHKAYGDLPLVSCYPQQVSQVFMNLLANAAQAIEKKGRIDISTRHCNDRVEIRVSDDGAGIAEENLSKVFDAFFTTKPVGKGTGLGLNVVYNIIKKHNGTIDVQSEMGRGTSFTIHLPVSDVKDE